MRESFHKFVRVLVNLEDDKIRPLSQVLRSDVFDRAK
jgi:hypothetical protein